MAQAADALLTRHDSPGREPPQGRRGLIAMQIHTDFTRRCVVDTDALDWQASPAPGVTRRLIERDGDEAARAVTKT